MYNEFFGLRKSPFSLTPDPAFLFVTEQHREALCGSTFAILQRKGFAVLTGDAGTGKTTLPARVLQFLPTGKLQFSVILNPTLTPSEFLELALLDFGLTDVPSSKAQRLWKLQSLLLQGYREGKASALIVDESHKLSPEVLEEIRMPGDFEDFKQKYLQILLIGQSNIPRVINALCDNALPAAVADGSSRVRDTHIREVVADLDLGELPRREVTVQASVPAPITFPSHPSLLKVTRSEAKSPPWNRWVNRLHFTPWHEKRITS